jgi:GT2 family glycosyltransferase
MLLSRRLLTHVGSLSEDYFLYYEEIDLAMRARGKCRMAYAPKSVVFHKEGRSIGSSSLGRPSRLSIFLLYANKLVFVRKFYPVFLPSVFLGVLWDVFKALVKGDLDRAWIIVNAIAWRDVVGVPRRY